MFEFSGVTNYLAFTLVATIVVRLFYSIIVKNWNYFSDKNVTYDRGLPVLGSFYTTFLGKESMGEASQRVYNRYHGKKLIGMYEIGGKPSYLIRDPDLIRDITIKDFDYFVNHFFQLDKELDPLLGRSLFSMSNQPWRDMRTTMSPLFTGSKMRHMLSLMNVCANDFNLFIKNDIATNSKTNSREYNMMDMMMRLTNDIIGSTAFGIEINTMKDPENEFFKMGKDIAYSIMGVKVFFALAFPKVASWLKLKVLTNRYDSFFRNIIHNTIEQRQEQKIVRNDMLNLLLLAKEGKLNDEKDKETDQDTGFATISEFITSKATEKLKNWTDDDLVAQCVLFFLAGFTGVATTFSFICYELSVNVDVQERLYQEVVETKEELNGKPLTFEALQRMKYMDMVVSEVLRLWPVGTLMDRAVSKQYLIEDTDGTKVLLQPNSVLWIPTFAIHRDPNYYPNPEVFDPERFSDENKKNIHPCAYLPFGSGPRACIASRFALLALKAVIFHLLSEFKVECSPKTPIPIKLKGGTNALTPVGGFFNQLTLRN